MAQLRPKHIDLLLFVYECRYATTTQLCLFLDRHRNSITRTGKQLTDDGYLIAERQSRTSEFYWRITKKAWRVLRNADRLRPSQLTWSPRLHEASIAFQQHVVDVNELRLGFHKSAGQRSQVSDLTFVSEPLRTTVADQSGHRYSVAPDGLVVFEYGEADHYFLIEVDRRTRSLTSPTGSRPQTAGQQCYAYSPFYRFGHFRDQFGEPTDSIQAWPFRCLITAPSPTRRNNLIASTIDLMRRAKYCPPVSTFRAYGVLADVADPFAACWIPEAEAYRWLSWLDQFPTGRRLAQLIPRQNMAALRDRLGARVLEQTWHSKKDHLRDAIIAALIETGSLRHYTILEPWPHQ